jgi:hypothetical protein
MQVGNSQKDSLDNFLALYACKKNCANLAQIKINHNKYQQFRNKKDSLKHQPIRALKYLPVGR